MSKRIYLIIIALFAFAHKGNAQIDEDQIGAWYMYFFTTTFKESTWGAQEDIQYRNWNVLGDLEQLLLRGGISYQPKDVKVKLTLGYGHITTGQFGDGDATSQESRIYQEILFPVQFGNRIYTNHRFRYEQRFVENQDFRTRYRYNLFVNIPLNKANMEANTFYLALYNEIFINGQRDIGNDNQVEIFDRNRFYTALGYVLNNNMKLQLGWMKQATDNWTKNQLQFSFHQNFR